MPEPIPLTIPFTVIGGFLGAGKTTLVNRLLQSTSGTRYAILVNDFGAINIDQTLIARHSGQTLSLTNGCICCSLANGFIKTMLQLMQLPVEFDHIIVEASGVADPNRIMDFARIDPTLREDVIIVIIDAFNLQEQLHDARISAVVQHQIEQADILIVNKSDLVSARKFQVIKDIVTGINARAPQIRTQQADIPVGLLLGTAMQSYTCSSQSFPGSHANDIFQQVSFRTENMVDDDAFSRFAGFLPEAVIRGKARLRMTSGRYHWNRVACRHYLTPVEEEIATSELVLIGHADAAGFDAIRHAALEGVFDAEIS